MRVNNGEDIIDSREVIDQIEELKSQREAAIQEPTNEAEWEIEPGVGVCSDDWTEEDEEEFQTLRHLAEQGEGYGDWVYGEMLIRDSYFQEYAQELAEDIGAIGQNEQWPLRHIDWEAAADELKQDYMSLDFDGVEYWMRA